MGRIYALSVSKEKGVQKDNVQSCEFIDNFGINGDAHAGFGHRQISFLAKESIDKMIRQGLDVKSGDFAENITTTDLDLSQINIGDQILSGNLSFIISQIGKVCHHRCAIFHQAGDCVMPKEGIFAVVKGNGFLAVGDELTLNHKSGLSIAVITLSDKGSRGERIDITGADIEKYIYNNFNVSFLRREMIPDEKELLEQTLLDLSDNQMFDVIITNGSTGVAPRDIAPDATISVIDKRMPGFEEAMRMESFKKTPHALISRAVVGFRKRSLITNLPGSPKGAIENLAVIAKSIEHAVKKIQGDPSDCAN